MKIDFVKLSSTSSDFVKNSGLSGVLRALGRQGGKLNRFERAAGQIGRKAGVLTGDVAGKANRFGSRVGRGFLGGPVPDTLSGSVSASKLLGVPKFLQSPEGLGRALQRPAMVGAGGLLGAGAFRAAAPDTWKRMQDYLAAKSYDLPGLNTEEELLPFRDKAFEYLRQKKQLELLKEQLLQQGGQAEERYGSDYLNQLGDNWKRDATKQGLL